MKKKWIKILAAIFACASIALGISACNSREEASSSSTHEHEYITKNTAPTCTEQGFTTHTCDCGETYVDGYVDALQHEFVNYTSDGNAKCEENGTETAVCSRQDCQETDVRVEENSALGHQFGEYISDNNATYTSDGTKTASCERAGCNETHTITDEGTKLASGIAFITLSVDGTDVYGKVSNGTEVFSFIDEVQTIGVANFFVSLDIYGAQKVETKTIPLSLGNNTVYITEIVDDEPTCVYKVVVRRRPTYNVVFNANGGTAVDAQVVEEDSFAILPTTERTGYTFEGWDYDFATPITGEREITASWVANTDTPYKVEYYLQNLEDDEYTLEITENKTGTTDTTATADIKTFAHFTHSESETDSGNIQPNGLTVLQVYYTRDTYTVVFDGNGGTLISGEESQTVKYGGNVSAPTFARDGYTFDGFDITNYTDVSESFTVTAGWSIITYTITYELDGGTLPENNNPISYTVETDTVTLVLPRKRNYGCLGWYDGDKKIEKLEKGDWGHLNLVAKWEYALVFAGEYLTDVTESAKTTCYEILLEGRVTHIGSSAFSGCTSLTSVGLYCELKKIGVSAFRGCSSLTSVGLSNTVTEIGSYAFAECTSLQSIKLPQYGLVKIGSYAFAGCSSLQSITLPEFAYGMPEYLDTIESYAFAGCSSLKSIIIPDGVTQIGVSAFSGCTSLRRVTLGDHVAKICGYAFENCSSLTSITIPYSVKQIDAYAFKGCTSLTSAVFEDNRDYVWYIKTNSVSVTRIWTGDASASACANMLTSTYCGNIWYNN